MYSIPLIRWLPYCPVHRSWFQLSSEGIDICSLLKEVAGHRNTIIYGCPVQNSDALFISLGHTRPLNLHQLTTPKHNITTLQSDRILHTYTHTSLRDHTERLQLVSIWRNLAWVLALLGEGVDHQHQSQNQGNWLGPVFGYNVSTAL